MATRFVAVLTLLVGVSGTLGAAPPPVTIRFATRTVSMSGASPGAQLLFLGDAKIPLYNYSRLKQWQFVVTAAADGTASIQTDTDIPITAVWVVADLRTGQVTIATPRPRGVATVPIGRSVIRGNADHFSFDRSFLDLLYVHAGEGAWIWHAVDGGINDEDGPNGMTTIDIAKAVHIAGEASPKVFSPGGTLVAIDFEDLVVMTTDAQALLPGAQQ